MMRVTSQDTTERKEAVPIIDVNRLRGIITERGISQRQLANCLGITEKTFCIKVETGILGTEEAEQLIQLLRIENPAEIFFAKTVT